MSRLLRLNTSKAVQHWGSTNGPLGSGRPLRGNVLVSGTLSVWSMNHTCGAFHKLLYHLKIRHLSLHHDRDAPPYEHRMD